MIKLVAVVLSTLFTFSCTKKATGGHMEASLKIMDGEELSLSALKGKAVLLVNIATQCGYTKQLTGLEKVYLKYKEKGLTVIGVPSNDFGGQTPEAEEEIKKFCLLNHGVSFPLTNKAIVKGDKAHSFFKNLIKNTDDKKDIAWNFEKFIINKEGKVVNRFLSSTKPEDGEFLSAIESVL